jgi:type I site-specific restriction endonuclease
MRINEVVSPLKKYLATVRVSGTMAKTLIDAESSSHATLLLRKLYGKSNVVSVTCVHLDETLIAQPLPSQVKHSEVINNLTSQITKKANKLQPTQKDIEIAVSRYKTNQKRANREYQKQLRLSSVRH